MRAWGVDPWALPPLVHWWVVCAAVVGRCGCGKEAGKLGGRQAGRQGAGMPPRGG